MPHKTTLNLRDDLHLRVTALARREGLSVGAVLNRLIEAGLGAGEGRRFTSFGVGAGDPDLGVNAEKYLREGFG